MSIDSARSSDDPTAMMETMTRRVSSDRIIGRAEEIRLGRLTIDSLLAPDPARRIPLLLIAGEAGIGKSRLLDELLDEAQRARCDHRPRPLPRARGRGPAAQRDSSRSWSSWPVPPHWESRSTAN